VYNRRDGIPTIDCWLFPAEVWLGSTPGGETYSCGTIDYTSCVAQATAGADTLGPFSVTCSSGRSDLPYVSVILRSGQSRFLTIGEVNIYSA